MVPMLRWWLLLTLWVAGRWLLPFVPVPTWLLGVAALVALLLSVAWLLWLAKEAGRLWEPRHALLGGVIALLVWVGLMRLLPMLKSSLWFGLGMAVRDGCLLTGALLLGTAGASLIRHANLLPPIAVVVTVMDIWTVLLGGFVHKVQQKAPKVVEAASVAVPLPAVATKTASIALPLVGVGDWFLRRSFCLTLAVWVELAGKLLVGDAVGGVGAGGVGVAGGVVSVGAAWIALFSTGGLAAQLAFLSLHCRRETSLSGGCIVFVAAPCPLHLRCPPNPLTHSETPSTAHT